jgi:hypothetical protein
MMLPSAEMRLAAFSDKVMLADWAKLVVVALRVKMPFPPVELSAKLILD